MEFLGAGDSIEEVLEEYPSQKKRRYLCLYAIRRKTDGKSLRSEKSRMNGFLCDRGLLRLS